MQTQSSYLAYMDVFWVLTLLSLAAIPLALSLRKVKRGGAAPAALIGRTHRMGRRGGDCRRGREGRGQFRSRRGHIRVSTTASPRLKEAALPFMRHLSPDRGQDRRTLGHGDIAGVMAQLKG